MTKRMIGHDGDRDEASVGLCATCQHATVVPGARSTFYRCELSFTDPRFPRYPALPVLQCIGFTPKLTR